MKILHVLEYSIPELAGYTIRSKYIVECQNKLIINPVVITSPLMKYSSKNSSKTDVINGIKYYRTDQFNTINEIDTLLLRIMKRFMYAHKYKQSISNIISQEQPNIIHSHSSYLNGISANSASKKYRVPKIYEVRGLWQDTAVIGQNLNKKNWKYKFVDFMDKVAMRGADIVVAISESLKLELIKKGIEENKIRVVPNGVDTKIFSPRNKNKNLVETYGLKNKLVLGFIGSVRKIEGLSLVLELLPDILQRIKNVVFLVVGGGDNELVSLKRLAMKKGLNESVIFIGKVPHETIVEWYSVLDIVIYPRIDAKVNQKVTPLKPLEAMAMERAVLASDVGGLRELISNGENGILFKTENMMDFMDKLINLTTNQDLMVMLGKKARRWVVQEREWEIIVKKYSQIYSDLINASRG